MDFLIGAYASQTDALTYARRSTLSARFSNVGNEGKKPDAMNMIIRDAHYAAKEAEVLVEFIGYFSDVEGDRETVDRGVMITACQDFSAGPAPAIGK